MAWTTFPTLTDGQVLTGAHMQIVRDNFAETAPGKATTAGRIFVATGTNGIAERAIDSATVTSANGMGSTSYADFTNAGPTVSSITTGTRALAHYSAMFESTTTSGTVSRISVAISGASSVTASDEWCVAAKHTDTLGAGRKGVTKLFTGLTAGSQTFTVKGRVNANSATIGDRHLVVMAL